MLAHDDRGSPVRVRDPGTIRLMTKADMLDTRPLELRTVFVRMHRKSSVQVAVVELIGLWLAAALFLVPGLIGFIEERNGVSLLLILIGVCLAVFGVLRPRMLERERSTLHQEFRSMLNSDPYCVACAYHLIGVPAEPDGCTVCPECGAAWNLTPQSQPNQH